MADDKVVPPAAPASGVSTGTEGKPQGNEGATQGLLGTESAPANPPADQKPQLQPTPIEKAKEEEAARIAQENQAKADAQAKVKTEAETKAAKEAEAKAIADAAKKAAEEVEAKKPSVEKLKVPENTLISKERLSEIVAEAAKSGKTAEDAQKQLDYEHSIASRILTEGQARLKNQGEGWRTEIANDPVLGGKNFKETDRLYTKAVKAVFGEDFVKDLQALGVEAHPKFVRGMVKLGKNMEPAALVTGERPEAKAKPKSAAEVAYGYDKDHPYDANRASIDTSAGVGNRPRGM